MPSLTPRMGLVRPEENDDFSPDWAWDLLTTLDGFPGVHVCTSSTRPSDWGGGQTGQMIWETDRNLLWRWNGTAFVRVHPVGLLASPAEITADFPTASTDPQDAISLTVNVPATNTGSTTKRIEVQASWYALDNGTANTLGACEVSIRREPGDVSLKTLLWRGRPNSAVDPLDWGPGGSLVAYDAPSAGSTTYRLCIKSLPGTGGTTTLRATVAAPASLSVKEVGL